MTAGCAPVTGERDEALSLQATELPLLVHRVAGLEDVGPGLQKPPQGLLREQQIQALENRPTQVAGAVPLVRLAVVFQKQGLA